MLITLTGISDGVLLVNPKQVTTIVKRKAENFTRIYFVDGEISCIYIQETPEEIYAKLNNE